MKTNERVLSISGILRFRIILFILIIFTLNTQGASFGIEQNNLISVNLKASDMFTAIKTIEKQSDYKFFYKRNQINNIDNIFLNANDRPIEEVLDELLKRTNLTYTIVDKQIVLLEKRAQSSEKVTVSGIVKDSRGEAMIGVAVIIKGTSIGVVTDTEGFYSIQTDASNILVFKFLGMKDAEMAIPENGVLNVTMEDDLQSIEEVVITGYGDFKKSTYTGSASVLNVDKVRDLPVSSITQMMEGSLPGIHFSFNSGQAGSKVDLRIRGRGSIGSASTTSPLFIIDGIPVSSSNMSSIANNNAGGMDMISTINPNDIESITVLKDAASASLYGSRGSNGVILITTKKGSVGKTSYRFSASYGWSDLAYTYREIMGGEERRELLREGFYNQRVDAGFTESEANTYAEQQIDIYAKVPENGYADWIKALFKKGSYQSYDFSATGGNSENNFFGNIGYMRENGVTISSNFERFSGKLSYNHKKNAFEMLMSSTFSLTKNNQVVEGQYYASTVYTSRVKLTPSDPIYNEDGSYNRDLSSNSNYNPLRENELRTEYVRVAHSLNSISLGYTIIPGLKISSLLSADYYLTKEFKYYDPDSEDGKSNNGLGILAMNENLRYNLKTNLSYNKDWGPHNFNGTVAYEIYKLDRDHVQANGKDYATTPNKTLANATTPSYVNQIKREDALLSYLGRVNYGYNDKYFLGLSYRRDGSSRLPSDNRWGDFWAVSGSWRVVNEDFMENQLSWLGDLKLRASYGVNGNLPDALYGYHGSYGTSYAYNGESAMYETLIHNNELTWEKNHAFDVGVDFNLFNRLSVTFDYYKRTTKDLLFSKQLYTVSGFSSVTTNIGKVENKGFEIELTSINVDTRDWYWTTSFNLSRNKNKILKLSDVEEYESGRFIRKEGHSYATFYLREYAGVNPDNGKAMYYLNDELENGKRSRETTYDPEEANLVPGKDAYPDFIGALTNTVTYKFVDLSFNISFHFGGWSFDSGMMYLEDDGYHSVYNKSVKLRKRWQKPGDKTNVPRFVAGQRNGGYTYSTRGVHSTDHIRLKSLSVGLNAPKSWLNVLKINSARLYFSGTNLLTWAAYDQYDPELYGNVNYSTPPLKKCTFGLEIGF